MSRRLAVTLIAVFALGFLAGHFTRRGGSLSRAGRPETIIVYRPIADLATSETAQEKITLRVVRIVDADGSHDLGRSDERPWEIQFGGTRLICVPAD